MPGPKMGPRPADFDEDVIRQSPTFVKWSQLGKGQKLRYACREFIKGHGDDEERLMRRIMIARRNNIRDHETLKKARRTTHQNHKSSRRPACTFSDQQVEREMDAPAVEATRSYRNWMTLPEGAEFVYNQKYIRGKEGHDWLLRKNIWRRMRYRRENKKMLERLKHTAEQASNIVDQALPSEAAATSAAAAAATTAAATAAAATSMTADQAAVEAAVAAAESFGKTAAAAAVAASATPPGVVVQNPLEAAAAQAALDAAAKLAAVTGLEGEEDLLTIDNSAAELSSRIEHV